MSTFGAVPMLGVGPKAWNAAFGRMPNAIGRRATGSTGARPRSTALDFGAPA